MEINAQARAQKLFDEGWKPMGYLMIYHPRQGAANFRPDEEAVYVALKDLEKLAFAAV